MSFTDCVKELAVINVPPCERIENRSHAHTLSSYSIAIFQRSVAQIGNATASGDSSFIAQGADFLSDGGYAVRGSPAGKEDKHVGRHACEDPLITLWW